MPRIHALFLFICGLCALPFVPTTLMAQHTCTFSPDILMARTIVGDDELAPPIATMDDIVTLDFDVHGHAYTRYIYKVQLCNADWTPNDEVFESDYLEGFNGRPIDDYEISFNTTVLYTHYRFQLPNDDVRLLLPGNYRVGIYPDGDDEPVAQMCFAIVEPSMSISADISANTDVDVNQTHQQLTYSISYGSNHVVDPISELHTVVLQNRCWATAVCDLPPNMRTATGLGWTHQRPLIFGAGNEFRKFEIWDVHLNGMNVDRMEWHEPLRHATLFVDRKPNAYVVEHDANGGRLLRSKDDEEPDIQGEYLMVHFLFASPLLAGGEVYVTGTWDNGFPDPRLRMDYDEATQQYHAAALLKQGYYDYRFAQAVEDSGFRFQDSAGSAGLSTEQTEGNFYQTHNEYIILVYHRPQGARHDALVGYTIVNT